MNLPKNKALIVTSEIQFEKCTFSIKGYLKSPLIIKLRASKGEAFDFTLQLIKITKKRNTRK